MPAAHRLLLSCYDRFLSIGRANRRFYVAHGIADELISDCIVLPSDCGETWGLVVNEAMACGRAAIFSDQAGCAADLVKAGQTGWCYPMGNVTALQGAMREALADKTRSRKWGSARRRTCALISP